MCCYYYYYHYYYYFDTVAILVPSLMRPASGVQMFVGDMQIVIESLNGKAWTLSVEMTNTIRFIKAILHDKEGIQPSQQRLIFGEAVLEDGRTLSHYSIQNHSRLTVHFKLTIFVNMSTGKTIVLELFDSETVKGVKKSASTRKASQ